MSHAHHQKGNLQHLRSNETRTMIAIVLSLMAMTAQLYYGHQSNSVSLEMEGWHMLSHVLVLALAWFAYKLVDWNLFPNIAEHRILSASGFISASSLLLITLWMLGESIQKLINPEIDVTDAALVTAGIGLFVNGISAYLLHQGHDHDHTDMNIHAAYLHVLADVLLGTFAIVALLSAKYFEWYRMDGICGVLTAVIVLRWSYQLLLKSWSDIQG